MAPASLLLVFTSTPPGIIQPMMLTGVLRDLLQLQRCIFYPTDAADPLGARLFSRSRGLILRMLVLCVTFGQRIRVHPADAADSRTLCTCLVVSCDEADDWSLRAGPDVNFEEARA